MCLVKSSSYFPDDKYLYHELINRLHTEPICYISRVECCIWLTHVIMEPVSRISFVEVANILQEFYHRVTSQGANRAIFLQATREWVLNYLQAHVWEVIWNNMGGIVACMMLWFHKIHATQICKMLCFLWSLKHIYKYVNSFKYGTVRTTWQLTQNMIISQKLFHHHPKHNIRYIYIYICIQFLPLSLLGSTGVVTTVRIAESISL